MRYQHVMANPATELGVTSARRGLAFLIDFALALGVVLALDRDKFSGAPAVLFLLGVYRVVAHGAFKRSVGKTITSLIVEPEAEKPNTGNGRSWWLTCVVRELMFYGLPGLVLLAQLVLEINLNSVAEGLLLLVVVSVLGAEFLLLIVDAGAALASNGRAVHDRIAGTLVRRSARNR